MSPKSYTKANEEGAFDHDEHVFERHHKDQDVPAPSKSNNFRTSHWLFLGTIIMFLLIGPVVLIGARKNTGTCRCLRPFEGCLPYNTMLLSPQLTLWHRHLPQRKTSYCL